ncbi:cryptochrome/photolyase family protein, partial [bacterium]|nr:cryptochrome/photolyase family protein [bacterium]
MAILRLLLGDQLSRSVSSLRDACADDIILMAEVAEEASYVAHHQLKLVLIFSAMRHFAEGLAAEFPRLNYRRYDDNSHQVAASLFDAVEQLVATEQIEKVVLTEPGEYRLREVIKTWSASLGMPVEVREDDRFIASHDEFATWFSGRKQATMEYFYRGLRRRTGLLMRDGKPEGGKWNYDADNRKRLPKQQSVIEPLRFTPDEITREVIAMVVQNFSHHMGDAAAFFYAVTQDEAQQALDYFCRHHLPVFGDYQDAMHDQQAFVFHSLLSAYINIGLLNPLACLLFTSPSPRDVEDSRLPSTA